jgi:hypothetical protein
MVLSHFFGLLVFVRQDGARVDRTTLCGMWDAGCGIWISEKNDKAEQLATREFQQLQVWSRRVLITTFNSHEPF